MRRDALFSEVGTPTLLHKTMSSSAAEGPPPLSPRSIEEMERLAMENANPQVRTYIQMGTGRCRTVRENLRAFDRWRFLPKVLAGVAVKTTEVALLSRTVSMPVGISPSAAHKIVHPDAELAVARAAKEAGTVMVVSLLSSTPLEEVVAAASPNAVVWAQLGIRKDRSLIVQDALRAQRCGCAAVVVTVDPPVVSRDLDLSRSNSTPAPFSEIMDSLTGSTPGHFWNPAQSWDDVDVIRRATDLPVVLKGILRGDDAVEALKHGVSAIIVSNHGGRYMDDACATLDALPEVVKAVGGRCEVYMDGGIRSGPDVVKALSLGAKAVFMGRPILYGLSYNGEDGVSQVLRCIRRELDKCLALLGCPDVKDLNRHFLMRYGAGSCEAYL
ncbi:2-Hydroxyacid oxidase 1-like isoform X2 [Haemaphysalis longicornis]